MSIGLTHAAGSKILLYSVPHILLKATTVMSKDCVLCTTGPHNKHSYGTAAEQTNNREPDLALKDPGNGNCQCREYNFRHRSLYQVKRNRNISVVGYASIFGCSGERDIIWWDRYKELVMRLSVLKTERDTVSETVLVL
jgi:hypothetical protein